MTTYTAITNAEIDADSPITVDLVTKLRDNPVAITEAAAGAPAISHAATDSWLTGTDVVIHGEYGGALSSGAQTYLAATTQASYTKIYEATLSKGGTLSVTMRGASSDGTGVTFRIYQNGSAVGTERTTTTTGTGTAWTESLGSWTKGDEIQVYAKDGGGAEFALLLGISIAAADGASNVGRIL